MSTVGAVPCRGKKKEAWKEQEVVTKSTWRQKCSSALGNAVDNKNNVYFSD